MPTYKNGSSSPMSLPNGTRIEAGQSVTSIEFFSVLPTGITKVANTPYWNPIILDQEVDTDNNIVTTVAIPTTANGADVVKMTVTIFCRLGSVKIQLHDTNFTPFKTLAAGDSYKMYLDRRFAENIILTTLAVGSQVVVTIERN